MPRRKRPTGQLGIRLNAAMAEKGWNQSDLARYASKFLPSGDVMGRDSISGYVLGKSVPGPARLLALSKALGVPQDQLAPPGVLPDPEGVVPSFEAKTLGGGRTWLRVNQSVSTATALKIMSLLSTEEE